MKLPWWVYVGIAGLIGWTAFRFQARGKKIAVLTTRLADSTQALSKSRLQGVTLSKQVDSLRLTDANKATEIAKAKGREDRATTSALLASRKLEATQVQLQTTAMALSAKRAKEEADRPTGGVGAIQTTENDTTLNRQAASLKSQIRALQSVADSLVNAIAVLTEQKTELEQELNGPSGARTQLNALYSKLNSVRSEVQTKRAELSKGIFRRTFNGGKIKVLNQVDKRLGEVQK